MTEGAGASNVPDEPGRLLSREAIDAGYALAREDIGRFNLGLFGLTGVGKSTLLNAVFGADLAATGIGDPVTQDAKLYRYDTSNLGIFDTKGLELGSDMASILEAFVGFVDANRMGGLDDQIHVIWYCIRAGDRRIQPAEEAFIGKVADIGIPVLLVMTQTPLTADGEIHQDAVVLADAIRELRLPIRGDVRFVNAKADDFSGVPSHGLDELLEATSAVAPEGVRNALAAAQQVDRKFKRARAQSLIDGAAPKLQGRVLLRGVDQVWAELFAGIAEVYDMPEERSREVLDQVGTVLRVRRVLKFTNAGVLVSPLGVGLLPVVVSKLSAKGKLPKPKPRAKAATNPKAAGAAGNGASNGGNAISRRLRRSKAKPLPAPVDPAGADVDAGQAQGSADEVELERVGTGLAAGKVTRALGAAWLETCDHYWSLSYPERPAYRDTEGIANYFADDLQARLPAAVRKWEEWLDKRERNKADQG